MSRSTSATLKLPDRDETAADPGSFDRAAEMVEAFALEASLDGLEGLLDPRARETALRASGEARALSTELTAKSALLDEEVARYLMGPKSA